MISLSDRSKLGILILAILLIIAASTLAFRTVIGLVDATREADRTHTVLDTVDRVWSTLNEVEASARAFVITGNKGDLNPYFEASSSLPQALAELRALTREGTDHAEEQQALEGLVANKLALVAAMIEAREQSGVPSARVETLIRRGISLTDNIRPIVAQLMEQEREAFRVQQQATATHASRILLIITSATAASVLIISGLFYAAYSEARQRRLANTALQRLNAEMEQRIGERTAELGHAVKELQKEVEIRRDAERTLQDTIGEQQRLERAERDAKDTLAAVIDASPVAIICVAPDHTVLLWSRAAEQIFGYSVEETIGHPYRLVPIGDEAEFARLFERAFAGETIRDIEVKRQRKDGSLVDVNFSGAAMYDSNGRVRAVAYALTDVTQRKAVEMQLRQAQKMEAIGNLTGGMAHDFNNLLGIIIGNLDLLREQASLVEATEALVDDALAAALSGGDLTRQLLAFARRQPLQPKAIDVNELVTRNSKLLYRVLGEDIKISLDLDDEVRPILVDPAQLEACLVNIASNSRDAMPNGGELLITTRNARLDEDYATMHQGLKIGDYVLIEVSDTGHGISSDILNQIFEPFFTTKEHGKGTGIGLSMVFGFMKQSDGHVNVYSEVGMGTTIRLYLPQTAASTRVALAREAALLVGGRETILAVEDNAKLLRLVESQLEELGYHVLTAPDGASALTVLEKTRVDLLFSDVIMPGGVSGYDLARETQSRHPGTKIVLTSGFPEPKGNGSKELPANHRLLSKPYRKEDLARTLREVLEA